MTGPQNGEDGIEMLRRMISYLRAEASRLRIMDVALLLEHAEEAVTAFPPAPVPDGGRGFPGRAEARIEH